MSKRTPADARRDRIERADDQAARDAFVVGILQDCRIAQHAANVFRLI
ncbi:hypothetical protein [Mesorhizobium sp. M0091]